MSTHSTVGTGSVEAGHVSAQWAVRGRGAGFGLTDRTCFCYLKHTKVTEEVSPAYRRSLAILIGQQSGNVDLKDFIFNRFLCFK